MQDLIDRQAAIDTLADMYCKSDEDGYVWIIRSDAWARIDALPSAQPENIRCKDCKLFGDPKCLMWFDGYDWAEPDGYCHIAERRTDENN